jgi:hypothetical protein
MPTEAMQPSDASGDPRTASRNNAEVLPGTERYSEGQRNRRSSRAPHEGRRTSRNRPHGCANFVARLREEGGADVDGLASSFFLRKHGSDSGKSDAMSIKRGQLREKAVGHSQEAHSWPVEESTWRPVSTSGLPHTHTKRFMLTPPNRDFVFSDLLLPRTHTSHRMSRAQIRAQAQRTPPWRGRSCWSEK